MVVNSHCLPPTASTIRRSCFKGKGDRFQVLIKLSPALTQHHSLKANSAPANSVSSVLLNKSTIAILLSLYSQNKNLDGRGLFQVPRNFHFHPWFFFFFPGLPCKSGCLQHPEARKSRIKITASGDDGKKKHYVNKLSCQIYYRRTPRLKIFLYFLFFYSRFAVKTR